MIAPMVDSNDGRSDIFDFERRCASFFGPGGALATGCKNSSFTYEHRPQQQAMACAVARTLERGGHLAVEAGTGVGKSFAYLVPLIWHAVARGRKAVVSTHTISLQEQLLLKDIPFLRDLVGVSFETALMKGRSNYICLRRLARAELMRRDLFGSVAERELHRLRLWADRTADGSLQDLKQPPPDEIWSAVCAEEGNCRGARCPEFAHCHFMRARRRTQAADLLIVNHHLLFADLALRAQEAALLPEYDAVVLDEAHQVESVASDHLGIRLSQYAFEHWMRRLYQPDTQKGLLAVLRDGLTAHEVTQMWDDVAWMFKEARRLAGPDNDHSAHAIRHPLPLETTVPQRIRAICDGLYRQESLQKDEDLLSELRQARRRGVELRETLETFLKQGKADHVYWLELEGRNRQTVFYSAPIEVGSILHECLFGAFPSVILTSATMAVNGSLAYFRNRIGADPCEEIQVGTPFDYVRQMRIWIPRAMPDPSEGEEIFAPPCAAAVRHFARRTRGNAFVLFTSASLMKRVAALVREGLREDGLRLLVQNEGLGRRAMLEDFRGGGGAVLFGLDSFWMGVDVPGEALSNVMITRLPFAVPDHPLIQARLERIRERGGDPFREYSLPEAVIKFRQGVGRLIRSSTDTGVVVLLDRRVDTKWYGRWFLRSIPEVPVEIEDWAPPAIEGPSPPWE